jgi:type II secretory pathway component PulK
MSDLALFALMVLQRRARDLRCRLLAEQRGEGVISAAIAVLVMAFLGVAMYKAFQGMFQDTADKTTNQINQIGG